MLSVQLVNGNLTVDLDEISQDGKGVEAVAGLTGLGLPPVSVQWLEGAGDGAKARNIRVLPRDLDIPLHVFCDDRDELQAAMRRVSLVLAGEFRMYLVEDGVRRYYADVVRTGGGTYTYGSDSAGEYDLSMIITVRAGVPYWTHVDSQTVTHSGDLDAAAYTINNPGTALAKPVWTINGPLSRFTLVKGSKVLDWIGSLGVGETITVDTDDCSVVDQTGANRYSGLATAPDMWDLDAGANAIAVTLDKAIPPVRTNYITNPTFGNVTHGWTIPGTTTASVVGGVLRLAAQNSVDFAAGTRTYSGLPVGVSVVLRFKWRVPDGTPLPNAKQAVVDVSVNGVHSYFRTSVPTVGFNEEVLSFVVPASGSISFSVTSGRNSAVGYDGSMVELDDIYVGLAGPYFDGSFVDTVNTDYAWTGTAHASTSTATPLTTPDPSFTLTYEPRDWMEV